MSDYDEDDPDDYLAMKDGKVAFDMSLNPLFLFA
jgi:hypothetical protein